MNKPLVLVVDDEVKLAKEIALTVEDWKFEVETAHSGSEALKKIKAKHFDIILLDIKMPKMSGIEVLKEIKKITLRTEIIMLTGLDQAKSAWEAAKIGAFAYVTKPFDIDQLQIIINKALEEQKLKQENICLKKIIEDSTSQYVLIGKSRSIAKIKERIAAVAKSNSTILITGESGTGKEVVARTLYKASSRSENPFIAINCGAIPDNLVESELFGHERGSYTGAVEQGLGKFELANNGTIFLDEISSMPFRLQSKLLRVLEDKKIERIGGKKTIPVDIRIVSATNINLKQAVHEKTFRKDLFYRLNVINIHIPPLRERTEDIPLFLNFFLATFNKELNKKIKGFTKEALEFLVSHDWPGNVRELRNMVERLMVLGRNNSFITKEDIVSESDLTEAPFKGNLRKVVKSLERQYIEEIISQAKGNQTQAAKILGVSRTTLISKIKVLGIRAN